MKSVNQVIKLLPRKYRKLAGLVVPILILVILILFPPSLPDSNLTPNTSLNVFPVASVVDGDTIKLNMNGEIKTVRLIGINTPESVDPRSEVECFGVEGSNFLKQLLAEKSVRLEFDSTQGDQDRYGRLLAYIWLDQGEQKLLVNEYLIEQGYANEYTYSLPYKYQQQFKTAERTAKQDKVGLWGSCT